MQQRPRGPKYFNMSISKLKSFELELEILDDERTSQLQKTSTSDFSGRYEMKELQCESKKSPPGLCEFFSFFHKRLWIVNQFFTHLLYIPTYTRIEIFIQSSSTLTKLCHIKRDYLVHIIMRKMSKTRQNARVQAFATLHKSLIALLIVVCGK